MAQDRYYLLVIEPSRVYLMGEDGSACLNPPPFPSREDVFSAGRELMFNHQNPKMRLQVMRTDVEGRLTMVESPVLTTWIHTICAHDIRFASDLNLAVRHKEYMAKFHKEAVDIIREEIVANKRNGDFKVTFGFKPEECVVSVTWQIAPKE